MVSVSAGTLGAQAMEERDEGATRQEIVPSVSEERGVARMDAAHSQREASSNRTWNVDAAPSGSPAPTPEPALDDPPEPEPVSVQPMPVEEPDIADGSPEAVICAVFGRYCRDAISVAACESTDYYSEGGYYHIGGFQLAFAYHADKFAAHGWDMWGEGNDIYKNSVIAFEIFAGRGYTWLGTSGWPVCGWRAGY